MTSAAASRYARALVDVVTDPKVGLKPEDAVAQLQAIEQLLAESSELRAALTTPAIQNSRKRAVMQKFLDELGAARVIRNFVFVIIDHRRVALLPQIRESFETLMDERMGFVRADVSSATALDAQQAGALSSELSRLGGRTARLRFSVDPALLGGVVARIGSTLYDGSIRGQLQQMRRELTDRAAE
jgi:F-type H+-transporting ATPase subunit delta